MNKNSMLRLLFQECMGILDDSILETKYLPNIRSPDSIKKTYLFDHSASHIEGIMTPQKWIEHGRIVANIARIIGDPILYKILILLTLTKLPYGAAHNRLESLHSGYLKLLQRRQKWIHSRLAESGGLCLLPPSDVETVSKVCESLSNVDQLALMHIEFINRLK